MPRHRCIRSLLRSAFLRGPARGPPGPSYSFGRWSSCWACWDTRAREHGAERPADDDPAPPAAPASVSRNGQGRAVLRATRVREPLRIDGRLDEDDLRAGPADRRLRADGAGQRRPGHRADRALDPVRRRQLLRVGEGLRPLAGTVGAERDAARRPERVDERERRLLDRHVQRQAQRLPLRSQCTRRLPGRAGDQRRHAAELELELRVQRAGGPVRRRLDLRVPRAVLGDPLSAGAGPAVGLQHAPYGAVEERGVAHRAAASRPGAAPGTDSDVARSAPRRPGGAAAREESGVSPLRHHHHRHRPAGSSGDVERPDGERRAGPEVRRDPEPDGRSDLPYGFRPSGSGRTAGESDAVQPALPGEAHVLPRGPGHLQLRHRRRAERQRRRRADDVLQPPDRHQPQSAGADHRRRPGHRQGGGLPGRRAQHPDRRQGGARSSVHQLQRGAAAARRPAAKRRRSAVHQSDALAGGQRPRRRPTAPTPASASSIR